jgi:hypothetical protein
MAQSLSKVYVQHITFSAKNCYLSSFTVNNAFDR